MPTMGTISPTFVISYPNLFTPRGFGRDEEGKKKYSCSAIWTPEKLDEKDKARWSALLAAADSACMERFKKPLKSMPRTFWNPFRDGAEKEDQKGYGPGTIFANLTSLLRPEVIDWKRETISPEAGNEEMIFAGCLCRAEITPYAFDNNLKGIGLGLRSLLLVNNAQERLDSRRPAAESFDEFFDDDTDEAPF